MFAMFLNSPLERLLLLGMLVLLLAIVASIRLQPQRTGGDLQGPWFLVVV